MRGMAMPRVGLAAALVALAAWSFRPAFNASAGPALLLAILTPVAVVAGWGCLATRDRRLLRGPGTVAVLVLMLAAVGAVTRPGLDVRLGPSRLLTGALPVGASGPELATVATLAGFAAVVGVRLAVVSRNSWLPLVPALSCLLLGLGLGAAAGSMPAWYAPVFVAAGLGSVLVGPNNVPGKGRLATGGLIVLIAIAAGVVLAPLAAGHRPPASLQALVSAPVSPKEETNPLVRYLAMRDGRIPVELTGTASAQPYLLPMVTLSGFNGKNWTVHADYRRAGTEFSTRPQAGPLREVDLDVRVLTPSSIGWLPRAGDPRAISVAGLGFDAGTGDVVVPAGRDTPRSYRITGSEAVPSDTDIYADDPAEVPADTLPLPAEVLTFIDTATAGRTPGIGQFDGLYKKMKVDGAFQNDESPDAPSGHGVRQIADLLRTKRGTSEQYASAFAVLGRHLGWDTRVVLGFRPIWDGDHFRIRGQDVHAWVQVRFQRLGWVVFDPIPTTKVGDRNGANDHPAQKTAVDQAPPPDQPSPQEPIDPSASTAPVATPKSTMDYTVLILALGMLAILCLAAIPFTKTMRRRRRRHTGSARRRSTAAWQDTVEAMRDAGIPVTERHTTGEAMAIAGTILRPLANLVDQAAYAPEQVDNKTASNAWRHADTIRDHVRGTLTAWLRIRALFSPRSLIPKGTTRPYRQ